MTRIPNPIDSRLIYVVDRYNPFVVWNVIRAVKEAMGIHRITVAEAHIDQLRSNASVANLIEAVVEADVIGGNRAEYDSLISELKDNIKVLFQERRDDKPPRQQKTIYDKYVVWLAKNLNAQSKLFVRHARDDIIVGLISKRTYPVPHIRLPGLDEFFTTLKFGAMVKWAEGTGINLNDYTMREALLELEDYEVESEGDIPRGEVVAKFDDGWTIQRLETNEALQVEGEIMQHCLDAYTVEELNDTEILSLRDMSDNPHVTIEMAHLNDWYPPGRRDATFIDVFDQIKGKQNDIPRKKYREYIIDWLIERTDFDDYGSQISLMTGLIELFDATTVLSASEDLPRFALSDKLIVSFRNDDLKWEFVGVWEENISKKRHNDLIKSYKDYLNFRGWE